MKTCDEVKDILPEMLPLVSGTALEVQEHLSRCHDCAELRDELAHTLHVLESSPGADELPEAFAGEVLAGLPDDPGWSLAAPPPPRGQLVSYPRAFLQGVAAAALFAAGAAVAWNVRGEQGSPLDTNQSGWEPAMAHHDHPYGRAGSRTAPVAATNRQPVVVVDPRAVAPEVAHPVYAGSAWQVEERPLVRYVSQAGVLLEAVADLEAGDPRGLQVLTVTLQRSDLLDHGDELLQLIPVEAAEPGQLELRRLIAGTQLVLRKVRNARRDAAPEVVWALRREVRETGLLDAYRQLLVADQPTPPPARQLDEPF